MLLASLLAAEGPVTCPTYMRHFGGSSKDLADQWVCFAVRFARGADVM
jgi:hypothetical protein